MSSVHVKPLYRMPSVRHVRCTTCLLTRFVQWQRRRVMYVRRVTLETRYGSYVKQVVFFKRRVSDRAWCASSLRARVGNLLRFQYHSLEGSHLYTFTVVAVMREGPLSTFREVSKKGRNRGNCELENDKKRNLQNFIMTKIKCTRSRSGRR